MKPAELYGSKVIVTSNSMFSGKTKKEEDISESDIPVLKTFWEDNDLQEITVTSSNIGFVKTYTKLYKNQNREKITCKPEKES